MGLEGPVKLWGPVSACCVLRRLRAEVECLVGFPEAPAWQNKKSEQACGDVM